jgi:nucleotide-binding universal stress UspA family protein
MTPQRIIIGYDRSADANNAARWALDEAERTGAPVEFFYAFEWPVWQPAAPFVPAGAVWPDGETEAAIKTGLRDAVAAARQAHPDLRITLRTNETSASLALVDRSDEAGLIVLGSHGHSAVTNLLGSVSVAVTAHAHCPVVIVRGEPHGDAPVVVGVDGSPASESALAFAVQKASSWGVDLRVVRAWKPAGTHGGVPPEDRREFEEMLAGWREKFPGLTISGEAVVAHPAAVLPAAGSTAQLLVVGSRGRGPLRGILLGSVSQHLLRHSACSVAVVHERA